MFKQMAEMAQRSGGRLVLFNWDDSLKTGIKVIDLAADKINQSVKHTNALVLHVSSAMDPSKSEYYIPHDGHPSALANKKMATYLARSIQ